MTESGINCVKCGKPLQQVLFGIQHGFTGGIREEDSEGCVVKWLVCTNPDCIDGRKNVNHDPIWVDV